MTPAKTAESPPATPAALAPSWPEFQKTVQPFLQAHCYECHGDNEPEAGVNLTTFHDEASLANGIPVLDRALKMISSRKMPPKEQPRPTEAEIVPVQAWMDSFITNFYVNGPSNPGRVTIRRLNRTEYNNTIDDLLGIDIHPADAFPADYGGYGFDNNSDVLTVAPVLMEKYLKAANTALDAALYPEPLPAIRKEFDANQVDGSVYKGDPNATFDNSNAGTGGGKDKPNSVGRVFYHNGAIWADYDFPKDGTYFVTFRCYSVASTDGNTTRPLVRVAIETNGQLESPTRDISVTQDVGNIHELTTANFKVTAGKHRVYLYFVNGASEDEYRAALKDLQDQYAAQAAAAKADAAANGNAATPAPAPAPAPAAQTAAARPALAGAQGARGAAAGATGTARPPANRGGRGPPFPANPTGKSTLAITFFAVQGPLEVTPEREPESYHKIMIVEPSATVTKPQAAEKIIRNFATRAFRRPATDEEVLHWLDLWKAADSDGRPFVQSIHLALQGILCSPNFLFRYESDPLPGEKDNVHVLSEYELASRLSYFLWCSMPDDELFSLAAKGQLRANLKAEVTRMLKSPKSQALVEDFGGQWLQLRQLDNVSPDPQKFPGFDESLRASMLKETQLFFSSIVQDDRSVLDFIDANYSYINERLAKLYGIPGITGDEFRRVTFTPDQQRGGIFTQGSILTITSYNNRTSPVQRGKWVLTNLLDSAPPPPPPDVPKLAEDSKAEISGTLRQRMEQHRTNPNCAACHERMDPIGFGLENFDGIGGWRTKDINGEPIDSSGQLPDGTTFSGPNQLKQIILLQKDQFCRCLAQKLLTFSLGRGLEPYDTRAVNNIVADAKKNGYKFSTLILDIVQSDPFQKRRAKEQGENL